MAKVGELIARSEWYPPRLEPAGALPVTVILPNYNRGRTGLFEAAIRSILTQTHRDFELIIVDDGSDDNSMEIVRRYMQLDERVGCIYHPANVGVPAVSVYEAYRRAQGEYISQCFNDNEFYPAALQGLLDAARAHPNRIVHGHVDFQAPGNQPFELVQINQFGLHRHPQSLLLSHNYLPCPAFILHRSVFERIGFIDPHIAMTRLNDWDLWRRCAAQYEIRPVDVGVCLEKGPRLRDSLGSVHFLNTWLAEEWMRLPRNDRLRLSEFEDYDIMAIPATLTRTSKEILREISYRFQRKFWWHEPAVASQIRCSGKAANISGSAYEGRSSKRLSRAAQPLPTDGVLTQDDGQILVVTADHSASRALYFDNLPGEIAQRLRVIDFNAWQARPEEMVAATAVIFVRRLNDYSEWIQYAKTMEVPHYWFTDDNHFALWAENPSVEDIGEAFEIGTHRQLLSSFTGILASTQELAEWFKTNRIHETVWIYPPMAAPAGNFADLELIRPSIFTRGRRGAVRIGLLAGAHRLRAFRQIIAPAIAKFSGTCPVELFVACDQPLEIDMPERVELHTLPVELCYGLALARMRAIGIDILIHPPSEPSANLRYKTLNALINAATLGAVPMVGNEPPFDVLIPDDVAIVCQRSSEAWLAGLADASAARSDGAIAGRLQKFVAEHYSGSANAAILSQILSDNLKPGYTMRGERYERLRELALRRARTGLPSSQISEINSLIELQSRQERGENDAPLERLMFLRRLADWPPNIQPISVDECQRRFEIRDCFGSQEDAVLRTLITVQLVMQNAVAGVSAAHSFLDSLGRWNGFWDLSFGEDLRKSAYREISLPASDDTVLGVVICLNVATGTSGKMMLSVNETSAGEVDLITRDLRTAMYMVPFLIVFSRPVRLSAANHHSIRISVEDASGSVRLLGFTGRDPRRKGPQEYKTYYALVADKRKASMAAVDPFGRSGKET